MKVDQIDQSNINFVATLRFGAARSWQQPVPTFRYDRAQRWTPESDWYGWCENKTTAQRYPRPGELLRSCSASLTVVLDILYHMQYERVYFIGFDLRSTAT